MAEYVYVLYYECCGVSEEMRGYLPSSSYHGRACWNCNEGKPVQRHDLEYEHCLNVFYRTGRAVRPTKETPPWRI